MKRTCQGDQCLKKVKFTCSCIDPEVSFCDKHKDKHLKTQGKHVIEYLMIKLAHSQRVELLPKLQNIADHIRIFKKTIRKNTEAWITTIQAETLKSLKRFEDLQNLVKDFLNNKRICKDNIERIQEFDYNKVMSISEEISNIKNRIRTLFEIPKKELKHWRDCDEAIFTGHKIRKGMYLINLNTFRLSKIKKAPKMGLHFHVAKLNSDSYFMHGGLLDDGPSNKGYIMGVSGCFSPCKRGPSKYSGAFVQNKNQVYLFGGYDPNPSITCDAFDIRSEIWKSITPLPTPCAHMMAGIIDKDIILSGYHMDCCYSYDDSVYTRIINLQANQHKLVFDGWVMCNDELYECKNGIIEDWKRYYVDNSRINVLLISGSFKKGAYIYFIDETNWLMRLNTKIKKLEQVGFS